MTFSGLNLAAVLTAAVAAWLVGAVWYSALSRPWLAAQGKTPAQCKAEMAAKKGTPAAWLPFVYAFIADAVMAWVLAGLMGHIGALTVRGGVISAAFVWVGFVATTLSLNNMFGGRKFMLTVIDGACWLVAMIVMGAVIGAWGP